MLQQTLSPAPSGASHITPTPRHNHIIERLLGAKLRDKITGAVHTVTGVLFTKDNPDYVGFRLSEAQHDRYSFGVLMRDFVGHEGRQSDAQAAIFNDGDGMQVLSLFDGGNISLPAQRPMLANAA